MTTESLRPPDWDEVRAAREAAELPPDWKTPIVLPPAWHILNSYDDGTAYRNTRRELTAILTCIKELDGRFWLHLSMSHGRRVPLWEEIVLMKELFLGDREAYQVIPPRERYVNLHPRTLHLFALLDGQAVLPDFTHGLRSL